MPQVLLVVRCYKCEAFQVDIQKKSSNKWKCKICGEKQSLKKIYSSGTGKDCRSLVQTLNELRLKNDNSLNTKLQQLIIEISSDEDETPSLKVSPPRKRQKYMPKELENKTNHTTNDLVDRVPTNKRAQKRSILSSDSETSHTPLTKYKKINNSGNELKSPNKESIKHIAHTNKWSKYIDENEKEPKTQGSLRCKRSIEEPKRSETVSRCHTNQNFNWNMHAEWDSFSEPSPTSHYDSEVSDIVDDQFEEFERKTEKNEPAVKPLGMFSTIETNTDLDAIFTI